MTEKKGWLTALNCLKLNRFIFPSPRGSLKNCFIPFFKSSLSLSSFRTELCTCVKTFYHYTHVFYLMKKYSKGFMITVNLFLHWKKKFVCTITQCLSLLTLSTGEDENDIKPKQHSILYLELKHLEEHCCHSQVALLNILFSTTNRGMMTNQKREFKLLKRVSQRNA